jgi:ADP-ribose pyrophosphatase
VNPSPNAPRTAPPRHDFAVVDSTDVYTGKVLALRRDDVRMPGGGTSIREIMEHPGAVAVAALDDDDRLMLIYQYRQAVRRRLWEMPAGLLDHAGEDDRDTAARELEEEVGLRGGEWTEAATFYTSPGFCDERMHLFVATNLAEGEPQPEGSEELELLRVHVAEIPALLADARPARPIPLWDGRAGQRAAEVLARFLEPVLEPVG